MPRKKKTISSDTNVTVASENVKNIKEILKNEEIQEKINELKSEDNKVEKTDEVEVIQVVIEEKVKEEPKVEEVKVETPKPQYVFMPSKPKPIKEINTSTTVLEEPKKKKEPKKSKVNIIDSEEVHVHKSSFKRYAHKKY